MPCQLPQLRIRPLRDVIPVGITGDPGQRRKCGPELFQHRDKARVVQGQRIAIHQEDPPGPGIQAALFLNIRKDFTRLLGTEGLVPIGTAKRAGVRRAPFRDLEEKAESL
jgi:hypothetical protein